MKYVVYLNAYHMQLLCTLLLYALKNYFSHYLVDFNLGRYVHKKLLQRKTLDFTGYGFFFSKEHSISKNNINFKNKQSSIKSLLERTKSKVIKY